MATPWLSRRLFSAATAGPVSRWERFKQSKAFMWGSGLLSDYKEAVREIGVGMRQRPVKASCYVGLLGGAWACVYTRPDSASFHTHLLDASNKLGLLSPWIRSETSDQHLHRLLKMHNEGRLRYVSLGLLALTFCADCDPEADLYEAQCGNLSVPWRSLPRHVLDVGFAGRWWVLEARMRDFDVNEVEFRDLPEHMRATQPPSVREVAASEQLHKDSWRPVRMAEEEGEGQVS